MDRVSEPGDMVLEPVDMVRTSDLDSDLDQGLTISS